MIGSIPITTKDQENITWKTLMMTCDCYDLRCRQVIELLHLQYLSLFSIFSPLPSSLLSTAPGVCTMYVFMIYLSHFLFSLICFQVAVLSLCSWSIFPLSHFLSRLICIQVAVLSLCFMISLSPSSLSELYIAALCRSSRDRFMQWLCLSSGTFGNKL